MSLCRISESILGVINVPANIFANINWNNKTEIHKLRVNNYDIEIEKGKRRFSIFVKISFQSQLTSFSPSIFQIPNKKNQNWNKWKPNHGQTMKTETERDNHKTDSWTVAGRWP